MSTCVLLQGYHSGSDTNSQDDHGIPGGEDPGLEPFAAGFQYMANVSFTILCVCMIGMPGFAGS